MDAGASRVQAEEILFKKQGQSVWEIEAERDLLVAENDSLQRLIKTKDIADLPSGFAE